MKCSQSSQDRPESYLEMLCRCLETHGGALLELDYGSSEYARKVEELEEIKKAIVKELERVALERVALERESRDNYNKWDEKCEQISNETNQHKERNKNASKMKSPPK